MYYNSILNELQRMCSSCEKEGDKCPHVTGEKKTFDLLLWDILLQFGTIACI